MPFIYISEKEWENYVSKHLKLATESSLLLVILAAGERAQLLGASCTVTRQGVWVKTSRNKPEAPKTPVAPAPGQLVVTYTDVYVTHRRVHINTNTLFGWF